MPPPNSLYYNPNAIDPSRRKVRPASGRYHTGWDFDQDLGSPIYANNNLKIIEARTGENGGYGNYILAEDSAGTRYKFAHLDKFGENVREGGTLSANEKIGHVGNTGTSISSGGDGSHLHFEVLEQDSNGKYVQVDPASGTNPNTGGGGASIARFGKNTSGDLVTTTAKPPPGYQRGKQEKTKTENKTKPENKPETKPPIEIEKTPAPPKFKPGGTTKPKPGSGNVGLTPNPMTKGKDKRK